MQNFFVVIYGPTGVGKSDFAEKLAQKIPGEIINADVGQFYIPLSIGTAKPAWHKSVIPHHLFDILDKPKNLTVYEYQKMFTQLTSEIWEHGNIPLAVGGCMFYILSLFFPSKKLSKQK